MSLASTPTIALRAAGEPGTPTIAIRLATEADADAVARLAALDSAPVPSVPVLLAMVDGEPRAALPVGGGRAVADPFHPTDDLVALLRARAAHLDTAGAHPRRRRLLRRLRTRPA